MPVEKRIKKYKESQKLLGHNQAYQHIYDGSLRRRGERDKAEMIFEK